MNIGFYAAVLVIVVLLVSNIWLLYRVLRPLRQLAAQTTAIAAGNLAAFQQPCPGIREIEIVRQTLASMAGHVRRTQEEGTAYRYALTDGQEAERARIAHELHDETVQALVAIGQSLELAMGWVQPDPARAIEMLKLARVQTVESVEGLRRLIADLRPPALAELGLMPALHMLVGTEKNVALTVTANGQQRRLPEAHELALFRAAQEAIRNATRHGQAQHIAVEIRYQPQEICLSIKDDGKGFQVPRHLDALAQEGHYGLPGIQERIQHLNGTLRIFSQPGQGAEVAISLPLDTHQQPGETVRDPVCGAIIQPQQAYGSVSYADERYYFCCPVCQGAFQKNPSIYLTHENA